jgi:16S rRNA (uracil1498-N3)-methyltransferase
MTTNFYAPPSAFRGSRVVLPDDEARHVCSVLRAGTGDTMVVVDGEGGWHRVRIDHAAPTQVVGTVQKTRHDVGEPPVAVTVGLGVLTKRSRFETFVEKAVELGVRRIVPLTTCHTETDTVRPDRLRKVMIAALKQCRRSRLPHLAPVQPLDDELAATTADARFCCHGGADATPLPQALRAAGAVERVLVLVGPEGGFAEAEVAAAVEAGCTRVTLGRRRLRAETAGLAALNSVVMCGTRPGASP